MDRLRETLGRVWTWFWSRRGAIAVKTDHDREGGPDARARFWSEFREGQREAEAASSRPR
jgi:hypothetical protein